MGGREANEELGCGFVRFQKSEKQLARDCLAQSFVEGGKDSGAGDVG